MWKLYLVRCSTAFVFCNLWKKWIFAYRLLQRYQYRRGTCSSWLQCANMEFRSSLRISSWDVFLTSGIYIAFWHIVYRKPRFLASEPFIGARRGFHRELAHTVNSLADLSFERFWCCKLLFLVFWCVMMVDFFALRSLTSEFLLGVMLYKNFDGIVFLQKLSLKLLLRWFELSF